MDSHSHSLSLWISSLKQINELLGSKFHSKELEQKERVSFEQMRLNEIICYFPNPDPDPKTVAWLRLGFFERALEQNQEYRVYRVNGKWIFFLVLRSLLLPNEIFITFKATSFFLFSPFFLATDLRVSKIVISEACKL